MFHKTAMEGLLYKRVADLVCEYMGVLETKDPKGSNFLYLYLPETPELHSLSLVPRLRARRMIFGKADADPVSGLDSYRASSAVANISQASQIGNPDFLMISSRRGSATIVKTALLGRLRPERFLICYRQMS